MRKDDGIITINVLLFEFNNWYSLLILIYYQRFYVEDEPFVIPECLRQVALVVFPEHS